jgi:predicted ATPase
VQRLLCPTVVGRDAELSHLSDALARAGGGEGSALFLRGEAGIGKTRLAREAVAMARRDGRAALMGRAVQGQSNAPFRAIAAALNSWFRESGGLDAPELAPFRPILATLVPEWRDGDPVEGTDSLVLLAEAVLRLLDAIGRRSDGCLLVLEDLHWADPETLSTLDYLAENLESEPLTVLGSLRAETSGPDGRPAAACTFDFVLTAA